MAMDRIQAMQVFHRIVETNSLSRAAETLGMPASSVTTILKSLETQLGVQLLQRTTRRLSLTPDGTAYLAHTRRILDDIAAMEASFPGTGGTPSGHLKVELVMSIGRQLIIPRLGEFRAQYPEVRLTLHLGDRTVDLVKEGLSCAIRTGELADSSTLVGRRLGEFRWMTCASPGYLEKHGEPRDIEALQAHECIGYGLSRNGRVLDWEFELNGESARFTPGARLAVNDAESYAGCGAAGLGIVRAGSYLLGPMVRDGRLRPVLAQYTAPPVPVSMVYARNRHLSPAVRAFHAWAAKLLRGMPGLDP
jgi:LysR family transcriptional regulator for bpeEF and oprC